MTKPIVKMISVGVHVIFTFSLTALCSANYWDCCGYWVGGNDLDVEGTFTWTSDNSTLGFVNWHSIEPDNSYNQDCVSICRDGIWTDDHCDYHYPYICKTFVL